MPVWNDKMAGHQPATWTGVCTYSLYLEFTAPQWIPVLLLTHVSTSTSPCACLWYKHHYSFCVFGVASQIKSVNSKNSHHTSCIHKGLHAGRWPDLMTSKPDSVSTLGCHWNQTGWCQHPVVFQWRSVLICIIGTHWNTTGRPLETHWLPTIISPVAFHGTLGSKFQAHWIATGLPPNYHWLRVRVNFTLGVPFLIDTMTHF